MAQRQRHVLTDTKIRNFKTKGHPFNVTDGDGLFYTFNEWLEVLALWLQAPQREEDVRSWGLF
jgi:hypothetical protein